MPDVPDLAALSERGTDALSAEDVAMVERAVQHVDTGPPPFTVAAVPDLAALAEAAWQRLATDQVADVTRREVEHVVRAVLEALPREWRAEAEMLDGWRGVGYGWTSDRSIPEEDVRAWREDGHPQARLVSRAVGPPIPAEEAP